MASGKPRKGGESHSARAPASPEQGDDSTEDRSVPSEIRDVSFSVSVRGYDRGAVDAYVNRVQHLVAELEVTRSPEAAVKHALEQVGEQTRGMLQQAGETVAQITVAARQEAEESTARAKSEADEIVAKAKAEAADILARSNTEAEATVAQAQKEAADHLRRTQQEVGALRKEAEARMRELHADTESIRQERNQLLDNMRQIARRVDEVASAADARFRRPGALEQAEEGLLETEAVSEADATELTAIDTPTAETPRDSPR